MLALTPASFIDDGYDFGVLFKSLKQQSGRTSKRALEKLPKRFVPIADERLKERVQSYRWAGQFKKDEKLFPYVRQTVTRRIHKLVERAGGAPFKITAHTFWAYEEEVRVVKVLDCLFDEAAVQQADERRSFYNLTRPIRALAPNCKIYKFEMDDKSWNLKAKPKHVKIV